MSCKVVRNYVKHVEQLKNMQAMFYRIRIYSHPDLKILA